MKNNNPFIFPAVLVIVLLLTQPSSLYAADKKPREFYQLTVYHFSNEAQEKMIDDYLQKALLPALHRKGIAKVGVFKAWANDTVPGKLLYLLIPVKKLDEIITLSTKLSGDTAYQSAGSTYINAVNKVPPYDRIETILLHAFPLAPKMIMPELGSAKKDRVYELRSYESATEKIFKNKVKMFNDGDEVGLFKRLNFNAVFYAEVIAGSKMPNLMYMTSFENMDDRNAHWKSFSGDPAWKTLSAMPEYQNNVSHIDITFLRPTEYSDL